MSLSMPELSWTEGVLVPEDRVVKGVPSVTEELGSRVRLGGPVSRPLEASGLEDPRVLAVLQDEQAVAAYTISDLGVTFDHAEGEVFEQVWVVLGLSGPPSAVAPIAWSMLPEVQSDATATVGNVGVKADLKLFSAESSVSRTVAGESVFLEAQNLLRSDPTWEFSRSSGREIRGSHRLVIVTRSGAGTEVSGEVSIVVTVRRRHWGIFPYRVMLGDSTTRRFVVRPGVAAGADGHQG